MDLQRVLPDRFIGLVPYNDNIRASSNFQMPAVFSQFDRELFLVGINLNFLLNVRSNPSTLASLLESLANYKDRTVKILMRPLHD